MHLDFLLLADGANYSTDGTFNIFGEFFLVPAAQVPVAVPRFTVVVRTEATPDESAQPHEFTIEIAHEPSAGVVLRTPIPLPPTARPLAAAAAEFGDPVVTSTHVVDLGGVVLPQYGRYAVVVLVDGIELGRRRFRVLSPAAAGAARVADASAGAGGA